ncbi:MAG: DEAD/DEAH box helicase [Actinobacteria bacterium]|nr:DEAD/DEAH box helicase [Actinomycetota bacterium]
MDPETLLRDVQDELAGRHPSTDGRPRIVHLRRLPPRRADLVAVPEDLPALLVGRLELGGVRSLYRHQAEALAQVRAGRHVVVATGTASGKSLCYQLPLLERLVRDDKACALYLAPTKALARDQLAALRGFRLPQVRAAAYDGDTPAREREAIRRTANVVLTNPDMLHVGLLPQHARWADFFHRLELVVVDECHVARGVFGSHVAAILRRLRRVCERYSAGAAAGPRARPPRASAPGRSPGPTFVLATATIANPGGHAANLAGLPVTEITADGSPHPGVVVALWEPPLRDERTGARRSTIAEAGDVLGGLVRRGPATLAFVRSRRGAELIARQARDGVDEPAVMAYRAGLLGEERRAVERGLAEGRVRGVATTDALELGIDVGELDAVVVAGWPGTAASLWQQAGRAGRRGRPATVVFVAADDPLDHYLLDHPDELVGRPLEAAVVDVTNPYVLEPHVECAAWERPVAPDEDSFAPAVLPATLERLGERGRLRARAGRWFPTGRRSPAAGIGIRSAGGQPYAIVEATTGALIGEVDAARAYRTVHTGAIYLHQGRAYRIRRLDLVERVALADPYDGQDFTRPRSDTDIRVVRTTERTAWGRCALHLGRVAVTTRVLGYERRRPGAPRPVEAADLDLPPIDLATQGLWLTLPDEVLTEAGVARARVPGAAHAAEHAAIGLLPLFSMCDRWDVGGVSTARHPDTGVATIFVYDGYPGGAGVTERAFRTGTGHLRATLAAIAGCRCAHGCPSCVQSPKCGNGNYPLDKPGAVALLAAGLADAGP